MRNTIITLLKILIFLSIGLGILYLLYNSLNKKFLEDCDNRGIPLEDCNLIEKVWIDIKSANPFWLLVIVFCFFISNVSRALRWQQLTDSIGYKTRLLNNFHTIMLGYFANLGFPRIGEVVRAGSFSKYENVPFEKTMGTVVMDRTLDMICLLSVIGLAFIVEFDVLYDYLRENASLDIIQVLKQPWFVAMVILGLIGLVVAYTQWNQLKEIAFVRKIQQMVIGFAEGFISVTRVRNKPLLILYTVTIWLMYYLMTYLCFDAFDPTSALGAQAGLMIFVFGSIGMVIPSPGGLGSYHGMVIIGLVLYGIAEADAFSFAMIIFFTINIFGNILFGLIALLLLPGYNKNYVPSRT